MTFICPLRKGIDRKTFDCGNLLLNEYFHKYVSQDVRRRLCACYVALEESTGKVLGFYTLCAFSLKLSLVGDMNLGRHERLPVYLLGKLAVDVDAQHQGLGKELLADAFSRCVENEIPGCGLVVHPKTEDLIAFYQKLGFVRLEGDILFLSFGQTKFP